MKTNVVYLSENVSAHVSVSIIFRPLDVASSKEHSVRMSEIVYCAWWERYIGLTHSHAWNVISTLSLTERGPIAVQQRLKHFNQSEWTTPDCQQTYIRVAAKPNSVSNRIYTNTENILNHYWTITELLVEQTSSKILNSSSISTISELIN